MNEEFYKKLKEKILPYFESDDGHGFDHTERVLKNALEISKNEENINIDILKTAVLLHDIARHKETDTNGVCHAEEGAKMAEEILKEFNFSDDKIQKVIHAIKVHRFSKGLKAETREAEILQDADRLDALGAVCLMRLFQYALKNNQPIHDPKIQIKEKYDGTGSTLINHIHEKILKIKPESFKTERAKEIAKERYKLIEDFTKCFMEEWT